MKTTLSAAVGVKSSLNISFMPSAKDCSSPNGPFMLGPWRCCMKATTRRSYQMVNSVSTSSSTNANSALSSTTHHGSLKNTVRSIGASGLIGAVSSHSVVPRRAPSSLGSARTGSPARSSQDHQRWRQDAAESPVPEHGLGAIRPRRPSRESSTAGMVMEPRSLLIIATLVIPASAAVPGLIRASGARAVA